MAQAQVIATVSSISGEAYARNSAGGMRRLKAGDAIREGETVVATDGAQVVLKLADGREMTVKPGETARLDAEVGAPIKPDAADSAVANNKKGFQTIAKALSSGSDLDALLEDPAAGGAAPGGNEGHTFVEFLRVVESVDPLSYQFGTDRGRPLDTFNAGIILNSGANDIDVSAPDNTNDSTPIVTGTTTAPVGSAVTVTITDGTGVPQTLTATVQPDGTYSVTPTTPLVDGPYTATATVTDPAGNTTTTTDVGSVDTVAVASIAVTSIATDNIVNAAEGSSTTVPVTGTVGGDVKVGDIVTLVINGHTYTGTVQSGNVYNIAVLGSDLLADFDKKLDASVTATDAAGNRITVTAQGTYTVDTTPPSITVSAPDNTNDPTPTITGTTDATPGSTVTVTVTDGTNTPQILTATVQPDGTYSVTPTTPLVDGPYTATATVTDPAGNTGTDTDPGSVDAVPPRITVSAPDNTNDPTPTITGTTDATPGSTVTVTVTDGTNTPQILTATVQPDGTYSVTPTTPLVDGPYTATATVTDPAGNTGTDTDPGSVDTTPPSITVSAPDNVVDTTPTITGTTDAPVGSSVVVTVTDITGTTQSLTTTVQPGGAYSVTPTTPLAQGSYTATATVTDPAGNVANDTDPGSVVFPGVSGVVGGDTVVEGNPLTYTVTLSEATTQPSTYSYSLGAGTAGAGDLGTPSFSAGVTYDSTTGSITVPAGVSSFTISYPTTDDSLFEPTETLIIQVDGISATGTILDNDTPSLSVSSPTVTEGSDPYAQFTVSLSNPSSTATTVSLALTAGTAGGTGVDFGTTGAGNLQVSTNGGTTWTDATSVTLPAGTSSVLVRTPITNDLLDEAAETFTLTATRTAGTTSNASAVGTATITDNDATPSLSINDITVNEAAGTATFTVTLSAASGQPVTVGYNTSNGTATAGADYTATSGTLSFAPGVTTQTVTVSILNDTTYEGTETFNVNLVSPTNATVSDNQGIGTIKDDGTGTGGTDNDTPRVISVVGDTVAEGEANTFTVNLSNSSTTATTVSLALANGSATVGTDTGSTYSVSYNNGTTWTTLAGSTATVPAGSSSFLVRVTTTNDTIFESTESYTLTATANAVAATGTGIITDNDKIIAGGNLTGTEDTRLVLTWANFGVTNETVVDTTLSVRIASLPADGVLQYFNGTSWVAVAANSTYTYADITAGKLSFMPDLNESGLNGYNTAGTGNLKNDYASLQFSILYNGVVASDPSTLIIDITPVADAPTLTATSRSFLRSSTFEELTPLTGPSSWTRYATQIGDGAWRTDNTGGTVESYFEGEYLQNGNATNRVLELETTSGAVANLYTDVSTVAGEVYHLSFDFAERINNQSMPYKPAYDNNQIDVFWNGVKVATLNTDTGTWTHFEMDLLASATGSTRLEFKAKDSNSLGGILDNISLTLAANTGIANSATPLPTPTASLVDIDGSESLSYTISSIPVGAKLSDGTNTFTATAGSTSVAVTGWNLANLSLTPPLNFTGSITLQYTATATESANGSAETTTVPVTLNIIAANAAPVAVADSRSGNEETVLTGNVLSNDTDANGDALWVTSYSIAGITGTMNTYATTTISGVGTFQMLANGSYTFTPVANWSGVAPVVTYTVADEHGGFASSTLTLNVTPVADAPTLAPLSNIYVLNAGTTVITTGVTDAVFGVGSSATYEMGAGVSQANLEAELGVAAGYLDNRFDPTGPNITDPGYVNVLDGKITEMHYSLKAGTTVSWNYSFANGEDLNSEVSGGYNDVVVLVVTDPLGNKSSYLVDSSEDKFPSLSFTGNYSFNATLDGAYTFQWLVLNSGDTYKDSWLSITTPSFAVPSVTGSYGAPIDMSSISAGLVDKDGSETLSMTISGIPAGAIFDSGVKNADGSWTFSQADMARLHLLPGAGYTGTMNLVVTATATETATGVSASTSQNMSIEISSTTVTYTTSTEAAETLTGTIANNLIRGYAGNDTINAGDGNDMLYGGSGNDTINGGNGNDWLYGGVGGDTINGGAGNDMLQGGVGDDTLTGSTGADTFRWELSDRGTTTTPASDTITDFDLTANSDKLDLRDLLLGDLHAGTDTGNLGSFLHFELSGADTIVKVSTTGGFASGYNAGAVDQQIILTDVNLTTIGTDQQIIQNLLTNGKLIAD